MYFVVETVNVTTAADGSATDYTTNIVHGPIHSIQYIKDATTPFTDGVDFTITTEETLQNLWVELNVNASKKVCPRQATHDTAGVASLYAAAGEPVETTIMAVRERIKIVLAAGGGSKIGPIKGVCGGGFGFL